MSTPTLITAHECRKLASMNDHSVERQIIDVLLQRFDGAIRSKCSDGMFSTTLSVPYNVYGFPEFSQIRVYEAIKNALATNGFTVTGNDHDYAMTVSWIAETSSVNSTVMVASNIIEPKNPSSNQKKVIKLV